MIYCIMEIVRVDKPSAKGRILISHVAIILCGESNLNTNPLQEKEYNVFQKK